MKALIALLVIFSVIFLAACQPEDDYINNDIRQDFIGSWKCVQTSKLIPTSEFTVTIKKDTALTGRIHLYNFTKLGVNNSVYATISTVNVSAINIPAQSVQSNVIQGSGTQISTTKLNFEYTVDDGNETDTLTAVFTKL
ncbi:MAG: hypothetical protein NT150_11455 [Bacteroidetes bacterium]|nr:hypothetical protein [Bacteroidota bacterium]